MKEEMFKLVEHIHPLAAGWSTKKKCLQMAELIYDNNIKASLEIGVFGGKSLLCMAAAHKYAGGRVIGIDPWEYLNNERDLDNSFANDEWWKELDYNFIFRCFVGTLFSLKDTHGFYLNDQVRFYQTTSNEALEWFKDKTFGLIHIDGNHSEKVSCKDVSDWSPKIEKGGFLVFDDSHWKSTKKAQEMLVKQLGFKELCRVEEKNENKETVEYAVYKKE